MAGPTDKILDTLSQTGLLLTQHARLPNVVTLVTGEFIRTSWWSHPQGHLIFAVLADLSENSDVLFTKLLYRKVTLVHRKLWPALLAVAASNESWQLHGLAANARALLTQVNESKVPFRASGQAVRELEFRLLARSEQVHTESGRHETALETWSAWSRRMGVKRSRSSKLGRQEIENAANAIGFPSSALPWSSGETATT